MLTSQSYQAPMVQSLVINGVVNTPNGNALEIADSVAFGNILIQDGANMNGNIVSDAMTGGGFAVPVLSFGQT